MDRDPADEAQAEAIAFGLYVLQAPIGIDHESRFRLLGAPERDLLIAKARFVLSMAAAHDLAATT